MAAPSQGIAARAMAQRPRSCCSASRRPRSADRSRPEAGDPLAAAEDHRLPALPPQARPLSSAAGHGHQGEGRRQRSRSIELQELTLVPIPRDETQRTNSSNQETKGSSHVLENFSELSAISNNENGTAANFPAKNSGSVTTASLFQKVERLERELESTSELLRQANRELARREASLAQLGRHNDKLRGRVARLESDVAVYRTASSAATSSSSGEDDAAAAGSLHPKPSRCCSARDRELLRTLAGIYAKIRKIDSSMGSTGDQFGGKNQCVDLTHALPDARVLEQVFANFWQEYVSMSGELDGCKQVIANQELRMRYLEVQAEAANRIKAADLLLKDGALRREEVVSACGAGGQRSVRSSCAYDSDGKECDRVVINGGDACSAPSGCCAAVANVERRVAEESHLLARLSRLQLDNNKLQVLNREALTREAAVRKELQRVQSKLSSFKVDLARATKKILGRESSCTFPAEVSLRILLEELVSLRRQNGRLQMVRQHEEHHRQQQQQQQQQHKTKGPAKDTVGRGLQPVPEESAPNGTQADSGQDDAAAAVKPPDQRLSHADNVASNKATPTDRQFRSWSFDDVHVAAERPLDGVSEKEYRIWFPRAEVADRDPTSRASSDWRTFREYRYTECSREGLLEKSLSVEQVHSGGKDSPTADAQQPAFPFHCVTCSMNDEDGSAKLGGGTCRILSSTKSQLYREHRGRLLSRLEDDISSAVLLPKTEQKPKLSRASGETGREEGEESECQTLYEKIELAGSRDDANRGAAAVSLPKEGAVSTSAEHSLSGDENEPSYVPGSAGFQDTSLVSEDDDFDDRKCTYVKVDSVDAEVVQGGRVGKETVIGGPSLDDLGYIAEEPEDEIEESVDDDPGNRRIPGALTERADQEFETKRTSSSELESRHQEQISSQSSIKEELNAAGERTDASICAINGQYSAVLVALDDPAVKASSEAEDPSKRLVGITEDPSTQEQHAEKEAHSPREANGVTHHVLANTFWPPPFGHSLSDADANERSSETSSVRPMISFQDETVPSSNTRGESVDEERTNTAVEIESKKESCLRRRQSLATSEGTIQGSFLSKVSTQGASKVISRADEENDESTENGVTRQEDSIEDSKETAKGVSAFISDSLVSKDASDKVESSTANEIAQLRENAARVEETADCREDPQKRLDFAVIESSEVLEVSPLSHHDEVQKLSKRRESVASEGTCVLELKEHLRKTAETISSSVNDSLTQKTVPDVETGVDDQKDKKQAEKSAKREQNNAQMSEKQHPEILAINKFERLQENISDFSVVYTSTKRLGDEHHKSTSLTDAKENALAIQERRSAAVNNPIINDVTRDTTAKAREEGEDQPDNANARLNVNELLRNAPKMPLEGTPEAPILKENKVQSLSILKHITGVEEFVRETVEVVSSTLTNSLSEKIIVGDEPLRIVKDNAKEDESLIETELHNLKVDSNEVTKSMLTKTIHEVSEVETAHDVQSFEESTALPQGTASVVANEESLDCMLNVSHSLPTDSHLLIDLGNPSVQDQENAEATEAAHGGPVAMKSTEQDALYFNPPTSNVVLFEESLSASIEPGMLRDVIALTKIDDATSVDTSIQDDNDQGFESLPCDQALEPEDSNEAEIKDDKQEAQVGDSNNKNVDNLATLLDDLIGGEDAKLISSSEVRSTTADTTGHYKEPSFTQRVQPHIVASAGHYDRQETSGQDAEGRPVEEGERMASASNADDGTVQRAQEAPESKYVKGIFRAPDEASNSDEIENFCEASKDTAHEGPEDNASKKLQYSINVPSEDVALRQHEELHEQGDKSAQTEVSEDFATVESASQSKNKATCVSMDTSASKTVESAEADETATSGEAAGLGTGTEVTSTVQPEDIKTFGAELIIFDDIVALDQSIESYEETTSRQETTEELFSTKPSLVNAEGSEVAETRADASVNKEPEISEPAEANEHGEIEHVDNASEELTESNLDETKYGDIEHSVDSHVEIILTDPQDSLREISGESTMDNLNMRAQSVHEGTDPSGTTRKDANDPESRSQESSESCTAKKGAESEQAGNSSIVEIEIEEITGVSAPLVEVQSMDALIADEQLRQEMSVASTTVDKLAKQETVHLSTDDNDNTTEAIMISEREPLPVVTAGIDDANNDREAEKLDKEDERLTKSAPDNTVMSNNPEIIIDDYSNQSPKQDTDHLDESSLREETIVETGNQEHIVEIQLFEPTNVELRTAEIKTTGSNDTALHDVGDDSENSLAEAYNEQVTGLSENASVESVDEYTESTLRAYAADIVSSVLTSCVTRLEENAQNASGVVAAEKNDTGLDVNAENTREEAPIKALSGGGAVDQSASAKPEVISQNSSGGVFGPIAARQPAFEDTVTPAERPGEIVIAETSQSVLSSISDENEEPADETPSPPSVKERRIESTGSEEPDKEPEKRVDAKSPKIDGIQESNSLDAPLNAEIESSHAVQLTAEQLDVEKGDVGGTAPDSGSRISSEQIEPSSADNVSDAPKTSLDLVTKDSALDNAYADASLNAGPENSNIMQQSKDQFDMDKREVDGATPDNSSAGAEPTEPTIADIVPDALSTSVGTSSVTNDDVPNNGYHDAPLNPELEISRPSKLSDKQHDVDKSEVDETPDPMSASRMQDEPTSVEDVRDALTSSEDARAVTMDSVSSSVIPGALLNAEPVSTQLSPLTKEQKSEEDATDSGSVSEVVTEEAASSGAESNHSSLTARRKRDASEEDAERASQENGKPGEGERLIDTADGDAQEEDTAAHLPIETERVDNESEVLNRVEEGVKPKVLQASQLSEEMPSKDPPSAERKPEVLTSDKELLEEDTVPDAEGADNETAVNSYSESSLTSVSVDAKESMESVSEVSTRESEQASEDVSIEAVTIDNGADRKKEETESNSEAGVVDLSEVPAAVVKTEGNLTIVPRENVREQEDGARFGKPDLSNNVERHHNNGLREFEYDSSAYKPAVLKSYDSLSRSKDPEVLLQKVVGNRTNDPHFDNDAEEPAKIDDEDDYYIAKNESTTVADNEKDSLGALSTVYESSLEYARSSIEENFTPFDASTTARSDHEAVGTIAPSSEHLIRDHAIVVGGVFKHDDYSDASDVNNTKSSFHESKIRDETLLAEHTSERGLRVDGGREDLENEVGGPEKHISCYNIGKSLRREMNTVSEPVGVATELDDEAAKGGTRQQDVRDVQDLKDHRSLREDLNPGNSAEAGLNNPLQSQHQSDGSQIHQQNSFENVAPGTEHITDEERHQVSLADAPRHELSEKPYTVSNDTEAEAANLAEQHGTETSRAHDQFRQSDHVREEQEEVAAMDFSDEELQSLEDMHAHNYTVVADVHVSAHPESHDSRDGTLDRQSIRDATALTTVTTTTDDDKEVAIGATGTNETDTTMQEQAVETEAKEPKDMMSTVGHPEDPGAEDPSDKLQPEVGALKTAVMVHEETKLEALECSEELLHSVATEADFSSDVYEHTDDGQEAAVMPEINGEQPSEKIPSTLGNQESPLQEPELLGSGEAAIETKEPGEGKEAPSPKRTSSSDAVEDVIVPEHIPSQSGKSSTTESDEGSGKRSTSVNGDLKEAVEKFSTLVNSDDANLPSTDKKGNAKVVTPGGPAIPEVTDEKVVSEEPEDEVQDEGHPHAAANAEPDSSAENEDSMKTDSSESVQLPTAGGENGFGDTGTKQVKEDTTHNVTESVEQSERTEGGEKGAPRDTVRSTRIFQKTVLRTESTRTVRKTRSFLPYLRNKDRDPTRHAWQDFKSEADVEPVEEAVVARQAFDAMSIPRRGLCPMSEPPSNACSVAVQALPSTRDQEVQVEFDEHDCITRLVELQIAMNEQEEVRRQDMKAACELVEKLEAMQLSESLMRSQLRAMDAERREQMAREARLRDELQAWQETVQQQQLLLQQLKEDLDDTEDTLAAQRQEANRLREQMLVLQESCDSGLLMVDVLSRADKEVQTPDGGQHPLSSSSSGKGIRMDDSSPVYLDQLDQHRRLSALVSSQLEATANRIAQLRREALANRTRGGAGGGGTVDDYIQDLAEKEAIVHQLLLEQQQMDELLLEHDKILADGRRASLKSKEGDVTPTLQTEEEKLCLVGARCLHENHPELIARQARMLQRLQVDRIGVFRSPTSLDRSSAGSVPRRPEPPRRPYHALLTHYPTHRLGLRPNPRPAGVGGSATAAGTASSDVGGSDVSGGRGGGVGGSSADPRRISSSSTTMTSRSSSHSVLRFSLRQQARQQQHASTTTAATTTAGRGGPAGQQQGRQSQPAARKTEGERVNRFVTPSRGGNTSKR
ncbi:uncharacterized protein LOC144119682 [Amblyomma americanum]